VKLLEAQPEVTPGTPPEPPGETPQDSAAAEPAARTCTSCGAGMAPDQDWCLACGHAAAPLAERAGWRSAMTVLGLTLVLVAGAVGASYAALSDDPGATTATSTPQVAAAPPAATTAPPAATSATPTTPTTTTDSSDLPKVKVPSSSSAGATPRRSSTAPAATPRAAVAGPSPAPTYGRPPSPVGPSTSGSSGSSGSPSSGTDTGPSTTPAPSAPVAIDVAAEQVSIYDPYHRATTVGDPGRAVDGSAGTSWFVEPPAGAQQVNVGYAIDLGESRGVRSIDLTTLTPGFKVEVYATDEATPPPDILDARWAHITDKPDVGTDGSTEHIVLGAGTSKYRMLLLWITQPPPDGARVRFSELKLFG
jgi:hypothetical protein